MVSEEDRRRCDPFHIPDQLPEEQKEALRRDPGHCGVQAWTLTGSPIVDGKYYDFETRTLREIQPGESVRSGPPSIDVYWHNLCLTGKPDQFFQFRKTYSGGDAISYVTRLGAFLGKGNCELFSLNVTTYSVVVVVMTELSRNDMMEQVCACGL
ncbi:uncharacterized protein B0I36DRAFT_321939 [Microdochium trichocladiopsis]|uniref:Uncharacterized protein n=1 Tax=Microdochium trichocladiopsis TaxID=1682393 RepID=A0A9P8YCS3_9PEZI|nr:uncharacterized protein B0I36DRAFT_321939 [Microdochium trichocladiopsis]KAH7033713.1 hypothetical protein B0I36DRAFT_321939 [Microdochium trichocladiopsis]